jgi:hypothetical protein
VASIVGKGTFMSRNPDFMMVGSNLTYVGTGLDYETTRRIYVLLDAIGVDGTISLIFDVIDVFDAPTGLEWVDDAVIGVVGQEEQSEYVVMLQNHLDLFALREKTVVSVVERVPPGDYKLDFIVNEEYPFSLVMSIKSDESSTSTTVRNRLFTIRISDDENIGTTVGTITGATGISGELTDILKINADTGRIYTIGVPSANNVTVGKYVCQLVFNDDYVGTLVVYVIDDCNESPCGNNPCIDTFKAHICNCKNGQVGEKCDGILEASNVKGGTTASNGALIGIVVGVLAIVAIILILIVVIFKKPNKTTYSDGNDETNQMMQTNPIFLGRNLVVTNAAYDYIGNQTAVASLDNPMYAFSQNDAIYDYNNVHNNPQLPLKVCQKDMVRCLANEETSELYGNVAEAKNLVVHDINV